MTGRIHIKENVGIQVAVQDLLKFQESAKTSKELPEKITTIVEAIHSGITRNHTFYPADNLEKSVESWTKPYEKPVIKNHDIHEEPVGRVISSRFKQSNLAPDTFTIELELEITDPDTIKKVLDGRYKTLSIGGSTTSVVCSACGKDLVKEGYCGHMKGRTYEGKKAHWILGEMDFDEISWVNVPADRNAQVVTKDATKQTESASEEGGKVMEHKDTQAEDVLAQIEALRAQESAKTEPEKEPEKDPAQAEEGAENPEQQSEGAEDEGKKKDDGMKGPTIEEQLAEAQERVQTLEAENTTLTADKADLREQVDVLTTENLDLTEKLSTLEAELKVAEEENASMFKQNKTLASYTHKVLAESAAQMQLILGKIEEGALTETITELSKQTSHSLKEQINQLAKEKPVRVVQKVENPLYEDQDAETHKESTKKDDQPFDITALAEKMIGAMNRNYK